MSGDDPREARMLWAQTIDELAEDLRLRNACGDDPRSLCEWVFDVTSNQTLARFVDWLVSGPVIALIVIVVAVVLNRVVRRLIDRFVEDLIDDHHQRTERAQEDFDAAVLPGLRRRARQLLEAEQESEERMAQRATTIGSVLRSLSTIVIYLLAVAIALGELGIALGPLIAGAGIAGVALGFGAQSIVRDFLSGLFILMEDQYGVGDVVDLGEASGVIEEVALRITKVRDLDGTLWYVPNGEIHRVANRSHIWARAVMDIEVAYDTDLDRAGEVIKRVADELWREHAEAATIIGEPELWGVEAFGASSIVIRLVARTEPGEQWAVSRELRKRLKVAFDDEGIEIPFPQRVVWMRSEEPGAGADAAPVAPEGAPTVPGGPSTDPSTGEGDAS
ncbi:MAG: mechanosensitive ion channel family protein [Actinomycetota bacterium]